MNRGMTALALVTVAGMAAWWLGVSPQAEDAVASPDASEQPVPETSAPGPAAIAEAPAPTQPAPTPTRPDEAEAPSTAAETAPTVAPPLPTKPDIDQLAKVRAAFASDPARAYELAQQGHAEFGQGALHEQREGLAILSLSGSDRRGEAQARALRFKERYPSSPLLTEIEPEVFGQPE